MREVCCAVCTVLYLTVLYTTVLYSTVLYTAVVYSTVPHYAKLSYVLLHGRMIVFSYQ